MPPASEQLSQKSIGYPIPERKTYLFRNSTTIPECKFRFRLGFLIPEWVGHPGILGILS
jgi:hypothetical protein